ncbi:MAG: LicD family protein [Erysipelotrichaceae bacterium]|nr:LicD family protein [Erysipelotrichaceae bacterium]
MKKELNIKETQKIAIDILDKVAEICDKLNLRYYIFYGSLIGAIRHNDFIPWDDDLDIMMPRKDHDILVDYFIKHQYEYPNLEVFNHDLNEDYPYMITRISDNRYRIVMDNEKEYGMGVFIDIYPFDGLGNNEKEAISFGMKGDHLSSLCYQATREHFAIETTTSIFKKIIKFPVFLYSKIRGKDVFQDKLNKLAGVKDYDKSEYVGCVVWLSWGKKDIFKRKWFDEYIMVKFGEKEYRVPKMYDTILRHGYGDYMQLPPEKERIGHHHYKVYLK